MSEGLATYKKKQPKADLMLGKLPPQAIDLEEAVLGAIMLEKDALALIIDQLHPESFYDTKHALIYKAIVSLFKDAQPVDILTVTAQVRKAGDMEVIGNPYFISQLTNRVSSGANVEYHAKIIIEHWMKREMISKLSECLKNAYEDTTDAFELLDYTEATISEIGNKNTKKGAQNAKSLMAEMFIEVEHRMKSKSEVTGIPSGITRIDKITGGWQKSDLIIIAARPAMGKTSFVLTILRNAAIDHKKPVLIFSLEMSAVQLITRLASSEAEINGQRLQKGYLRQDEFASLVGNTSKLSAAPLWVDDTPALSILELRAKARRLKSKHDIQLIVVDYLQLMSAGTINKYGSNNREQEISMISRSLKNLAKELIVPVIALSQLSRAVETRGGDKRPQLSDLRESGAIEQDADMVAFLYRPEYYGITQDEQGNSTIGYAEYIIQKHRNGALDAVGMKFEPEYTRFLNYQDFTKLEPGF